MSMVSSASWWHPFRWNTIVVVDGQADLRSPTTLPVGALSDLQALPLAVVDLSDTEAIMASLAIGDPIKVDCSAFVREQLETLNLDALAKLDVPAHTHSRGWSKFLMPVENSVKVPLSTIVARMAEVWAKRPDIWGSFGIGITGTLQLFLSKCRALYLLCFDAHTRSMSSNYAAINLLELSVRGIVKHVPIPFAAAWAHVHSFVWIGGSPGTVHYDLFDNVLIQLQGRKDVLVIPASHTEELGGQQEHTGLLAFALAKPLLRKYPALRAHARYVTLEAGEGLVIPCGAYHAPTARTWDSLSINAFLHGGPRTNAHARKYSEWMDDAGEVLYDPNRNLKFVAGPYEFFGRTDGRASDIREAVGITEDELDALIDARKDKVTADR